VAGAPQRRRPGSPVDTIDSQREHHRQHPIRSRSGRCRVLCGASRGHGASPVPSAEGRSSWVPWALGAWPS
jgi:hypothetical protein